MTVGEEVIRIGDGLVKELRLLGYDDQTIATMMIVSVNKNLMRVNERLDRLIEIMDEPK
jgi:hypothetical protein